MYHCFTDKEYLDRARPLVLAIVERVQDLVREAGMSCQFFGVGSNSRNMITQNENGPIDFDFNLNILACKDLHDARGIKETVRKCFNQAMHKFGYDDVQDSTSSLTTKKVSLKKGPRTEFSIDLAVVTKIDGKWNRLIHHKTSNTAKDEYIWNESPESKNFKKKEVWLKKHDYWTEVRDRYLVIKNRYLSENNHEHPSFICLIEAVNEIYQKFYK